MSAPKRKTLYALVRISVPHGTQMTSADLAAEVKNQAQDGVEEDARWRTELSERNENHVTKMRVRGLSVAEVRAMGIAIDP